MDTKIFGGGKRETTTLYNQIRKESVFVWEPTKPQSSGGDSNPAAILANYSGNHSVSFSDATYLRGWLLLYHRPSVSRSLLSLTLNLAFQPLSLRCLFIIVTKIFKETHQPIIIHPQSSLKATKKNQYKSRGFFTFFHFFLGLDKHPIIVYILRGSD